MAQRAGSGPSLGPRGSACIRDELIQRRVVIANSPAAKCAIRSATTDTIAISATLGSRVVVVCQDTSVQETFHLVFGDSANFDEGHLTMSSPIGKALIGRAVGDDVLLKLPAKTRRMRILELRTIHEGHLFHL